MFVSDAGVSGDVMMCHWDVAKDKDGTRKEKGSREF